MWTGVVRGVGRALMGSTLAVLGFDAARAPGVRVGQAAGTLAVVRKVLPLPQDDELIVRANGAVQVAAGTMLSLGRAPRLSAFVLVASLVPTTLAGHAFWDIEDPAMRKSQRTQFHKNTAMIGGLILAICDATTSRDRR
jgi:uncharacterized membrane protein YphA (DoxX/SURF4 family)